MNSHEPNAAWHPVGISTKILIIVIKHTDYCLFIKLLNHIWGMIARLTRRGEQRVEGVRRAGGRVFR